MPPKSAVYHEEIYIYFMGVLSCFIAIASIINMPRPLRMPISWLVHQKSSNFYLNTATVGAFTIVLGIESSID